MDNSDALTVLKALYSNLVNELTQNSGHLDDKSREDLAWSIVAIIKETYNEFCEPDDKLP